MALVCVSLADGGLELDQTHTRVSHTCQFQLILFELFSLKLTHGEGGKNKPACIHSGLFLFYLHQNKFSLSDTDGVKKVSLKKFLHLNSSAHFVVPFLFVVS